MARVLLGLTLIKARYLILITILAAAALGLAYSYFVEPRRLVLNVQDLPVKGLDPAFDGLKIVAIADIHGGSNYVTEERIREVVAKANEQQPDLIVLLGDYVSEEFGPSAPLKMPMATIADNLAGLKARFGVYAVLGNHDGWYDDDTVARELKRIGVTVLQNEVASIDVNGKRLRVVGLKDHMKLAPRWSDISADSRDLLKDSTGQIILLEHSPDILPVITGSLSISPELRLILAAHTHGGQVRFPLIGAPIVPSSYGQRYLGGHIRENNVDMFVTTGIGTSVLPFRFLVPPEIAVLTLKAE
ncbi:MAG TPA: metallophosphoesterase [Pyrinomonadaceae bacterium]|nr:metallophosphoesterase [Pyrinomonadaceae bacterium]